MMNWSLYNIKCKYVWWEQWLFGHNFPEYKQLLWMWTIECFHNIQQTLIMWRQTQHILVPVLTSQLNISSNKQLQNPLSFTISNHFICSCLTTKLLWLLDNSALWWWEQLCTDFPPSHHPDLFTSTSWSSALGYFCTFTIFYTRLPRWMQLLYLLICGAFMSLTATNTTR